MPQVLTMTQMPDEAPEQFAARIAAEAGQFFGGSAEATDESTAAEPESTKPADGTSSEPAAGPTDETADAGATPPA
jgi:hypothetical protein